MGLTESAWAADATEPVLETTVGGVLRDAAEGAPGRVALVAARVDPALRRRWTFEELLSDAEAVARALLARFQPGERVAVWAPNVPEWVLLEYGAALAGIVLVTVNPVLRSQEVSYILTQSRAAGVFLAPEHRGSPLAAIVEDLRPDLPDLREVVSLAAWQEFCASGSPTERLPDVRPDDAAQIQYTSGTTGFPKGALLRHRGITNNARFCAERLGVEEGAAWVNPMPLFHTGGCVLATLGPLQRAATEVLIEAFEPGLVLEQVEAERAQILGGVPTMLIGLMEHPDFAGRDLSSLHAVLSGGSTVPAELVRRIEDALGVDFAIVYGLTEASPVITQTRRDDSTEDKALTIGQPLPQTGVRIVDPTTGEVVPTGAVGEMCTHGYLVMQGYFDKPAETAETIDAFGWLHTGDLCSMDERGYCTVEGRLKDMIIRGGENIYPREIEEVLFTHGGVGDVAIVGVPDERWGEQVAAFVRPAPGRQPTEAELRAFVRERLAPHKAPRVWAFLEEFPLTASGKTQKYVLRERWEKGEFD